MTKCYLVKLRDVESISPKAIKATDYQSNTCILPKSQVMCDGGNRYWVAEFILRQKNLVYSYKNMMWVDLVTGFKRPIIEIEEYVPEKIEVNGIREVEELNK